jgi:DNA-binding IclR family transcriptional regulator
MNRYNRLKQRTLSAFADAGGEWLKPKEIANRLNFLPRRSAWTYLKRLRRFGLLERRSFGKGTLHYRISKAGTARLQWLRSGKGAS